MAADSLTQTGTQLFGPELHEVIAEIEQAFEAGNYPLTVKLIARDILSAWYGMAPMRTNEILGTLNDELGSLPPVLEGFLNFTSSGVWQTTRPIDVTGVYPSDSEELAKLRGFLEMFMLRLHGRPSDAYARIAELQTEFGPLRPLFDINNGFALFAATQGGFTAMLAAEFPAAMALFTTAVMHPRVPRLRFLVRDAYTKHALLQALFGDEAEARRLLDGADKVERTSSWAEAGIDADRTMVEALLSPSEEAVRKLQGLSVQDLGEMWPLYTLALHRTLLRAGKKAESVAQLKVLEGVPFARAEGQGIPGSVFPFLLAASEAISGRWSEARALLAKADSRFPLTELLEAAIDAQVGRPGQALRTTTALRERTQMFPQLERRRLGVVASAHLALGERQVAQKVLEQAMAIGDGPTDQEMLYYSPKLRSFALEHVAGWKSERGDFFQDLADIDSAEARLTKREREIVAELAKGHSHEQIATNLFISINTMKKHTQSLYRKLGVSSWREAVVEAERRGLL